MNAEIIAIGSELLLGQIVNSNAAYLSKELSVLGVNVYHHETVGDNHQRLEKILDQAMARSDLVITTGGLGPTKDDLTKEVLASLTNKDLVYDKETEKNIEAFYARRNQNMTENNRKQAMVLSDSDIIPNRHGLSCGLVVEHKNCRIMMLPGPPNELKPMFREEAGPYLKNLLSEHEEIESRVLRFFEIGESRLAEKLDDLIEQQTNPTIAPLASIGEVMLRLTVKGSDKDSNHRALEHLKGEILERISEFYIGEGEEPLVNKIVALLKSRKLTVSAAESVTGGLFSATLTSVQGVSSVFPGSIVCYSNQVKEMVLSVPRDLILTEGVVSEACARVMAEQTKILMNTDIGISFTGVAGPESLENHTPGKVFIGISDGTATVVHELDLAGSRENIQDRTVKYGCFYLRKFLLNE